MYGLDIETDTVGDLGLDPRRGGIVNIALDTDDETFVFDTADIRSLVDHLPDRLRAEVVQAVRSPSLDPEALVLIALDVQLAMLEPGIVATWNGQAFDLPFIATRAQMLGLDLGLRLTPDPTIPLKYGALAGHDGAYRARWGVHGHIDICFAYRDFAASTGCPWSLKPVCREQGIEMIEVDRSRIEDLSIAERKAYVASDARGTRLLTELLATPESLVDTVD